MDARAHSEPPRKKQCVLELVGRFPPRGHHVRARACLFTWRMHICCDDDARAKLLALYSKSSVHTHARDGRDGRMRSTHIYMTPKRAIDHDRDDLFLSFAEFIFYLARRLERPAVEHTSTSAALLKPGDGKSGFFFRLLLSISITNCWALIGRGMYGVCPVVRGDFLANAAGTVVKFYEREIWKNAASFLS